MQKSIRLVFTAFGLCAALSLSLAMSTSAVDASAASKLKTYDLDKDGTLDIKEVTAAAEATFDALDKDKDGTLTIAELQGRLSKAEFAAGDPDHDKTLTKAEFVAIVLAAFKAADADGDGTLDAKELKSKAGLVAPPPVEIRRVFTAFGQGNLKASQVKPRVYARGRLDLHFSFVCRRTRFLPSRPPASLALCSAFSACALAPVDAGCWHRSARLRVTQTGSSRRRKRRANGPKRPARRNPACWRP